jgi:hypothetical protein
MMDEHTDFNPMTADKAAINERPLAAADIQIIECVPYVKEIKAYAKELPFYYNAQMENQFPTATLDSGLYSIVTDTKYRKFVMTAADVIINRVIAKGVIRIIADDGTNLTLRATLASNDNARKDKSTTNSIYWAHVKADAGALATKTNVEVAIGNVFKDAGLTVAKSKERTDETGMGLKIWHVDFEEPSRANFEPSVLKSKIRSFKEPVSGEYFTTSQIGKQIAQDMNVCQFCLTFRGCTCNNNRTGGKNPMAASSFAERAKKRHQAGR